MLSTLLQGTLLPMVSFSIILVASCFFNIASSASHEEVQETAEKNVLSIRNPDHFQTSLVATTTDEVLFETTKKTILDIYEALAAAQKDSFERDMERESHILLLPTSQKIQTAQVFILKSGEPHPNPSDQNIKDFFAQRYSTHISLIKFFTGRINSFNSLTQETVSLNLRTTLDAMVSRLIGRVMRPSVFPSTLPGDMENHSHSLRRIAEEYIFSYRNEALIAQLLASLVPPSNVDSCFQNFIATNESDSRFIFLRNHFSIRGCPR